MRREVAKRIGQRLMLTPNPAYKDLKPAYKEEGLDISVTLVPNQGQDHERGRGWQGNPAASSQSATWGRSASTESGGL